MDGRCETKRRVERQYLCTRGRHDDASATRTRMASSGRASRKPDGLVRCGRSLREPTRPPVPSGDKTAALGHGLKRALLRANRAPPIPGRSLAPFHWHRSAASAPTLGRPRGLVMLDESHSRRRCLSVSRSHPCSAGRSDGITAVARQPAGLPTRQALHVQTFAHHSAPLRVRLILRRVSNQTPVGIPHASPISLQAAGFVPTLNFANATCGSLASGSRITIREGRLSHPGNAN